MHASLGVSMPEVRERATNVDRRESGLVQPLPRAVVRAHIVQQLALHTKSTHGAYVQEAHKEKEDIAWDLSEVHFCGVCAVNHP